MDSPSAAVPEVKNNLHNYDGSAFLFVLILAVIGSIMMSSLFMTSGFSTKKSMFRREKVSALNIAEAGKETTIARIRTGTLSPALGKSIIFDTTPFGAGYYTVTCSTNTTKDSICLWATGYCSNESTTIEARYQVTPGTGSTGKAFENGICVGGNITLSGSGSLSCGTATVHCNGSYTMSGSSIITANVSSCTGLTKTGSCNIFGNVSAPIVNQVGRGTISGTITTGVVDSIEIPEIDLTPYYEHALANGQVHGTSVSISGPYDYIVPGGIMWVEGTFTRSGSGDFHGCVIATGNIYFAGSGDNFKVEEYPLMLTSNGDIYSSGSGKMQGLLYAQNGSFIKSGSGDITGSIICKNDFTKSGSWEKLDYTQSIPIPPGGVTATTVSLYSWREI